MAWLSFWQRTTDSHDRHSSEISTGNVRDELMFHFRELIHEKVAEGSSLDSAWEQAEQQFGSMRRYENECHKIQWERRNNRRTAGAITGILLLAWFGWMLVEIRGRELNRGLQQIRDELVTSRQERSDLNSDKARDVNDQLLAIRDVLFVAVREADVKDDIQQIHHNMTILLSDQNRFFSNIRQSALKPAYVDGTDLTGQILSDDQNALSDATVLVIVKTWPDGFYQQQAFTATTNADGRFLLPELVPTDGKYAIQVAALKDGFAFKSFYKLIESPISESPDPITLQLEKSSIVTLVVRDEKGHPIPNAQVIPFSRKSKHGERHQIYFQGSDSIRRTTDGDGRIQLTCFLLGDAAEVYLQVPGDEWKRHPFEFSANEMVFEVASLDLTVN